MPSGHKKAPAGNLATVDQADIVFEHQGREIRLVFSLYSGREQVFVDNQLVSECRSWRFKNQHAFEAGDIRYVLEVSQKKSLRDIAMGVIDIRLLANGTLIDSDRFNGVRHVLDNAANNRKLTGSGWLLVLFCSLLGAIAGFAVAHFTLTHFL